MKLLWAPWRGKYVENVDQQSGCFLCEAISQPEEKLRDYLVLYRGRKAFVIFNKYPYNSGHLMVVPIDHIDDLQDVAEKNLKERLKEKEKGEIIVWDEGEGGYRKGCHKGG